MPSLPNPIACRGCDSPITSAAFIRHGWCAHCKKFQYEIVGKDHRGELIESPSVQLDVVFGDIQRSRLATSDVQMSVLFETYRGKDGRNAHRACVLIDGKVREYSRRDQESPSDALLELYHLCKGSAPEDI